MAPVNHNHLQKTTMLKIVHTLLGNFCQYSDGTNDTAALEDMGRDASVMIGCHELSMEPVSRIKFFRVFPELKNTFLNITIYKPQSSATK